MTVAQAKMPGYPAIMKRCLVAIFLFTAGLPAVEQKYIPNLPSDAKQIIDNYHDMVSKMNQQKEIDLIDPMHGTANPGYYNYGPVLSWTINGVYTQGYQSPIYPTYIWPAYDNTNQQGWDGVCNAHKLEMEKAAISDTSKEDGLLNSERTQWSMDVMRSVVQIHKEADAIAVITQRNYDSVIRSIQQDKSFQNYRQTGNSGMSNGNQQAANSGGDDLHAQNIQSALDRAAISRNSSLIEKWYEFQFALCRKNMINDLNELSRFYGDDSKPEISEIIKNQEKIIR